MSILAENRSPHAGQPPPKPGSSYRNPNRSLLRAFHIPQQGARLQGEHTLGRDEARFINVFVVQSHPWFNREYV